MEGLRRLDGMIASAHRAAFRQYDLQHLFAPYRDGPWTSFSFSNPAPPATQPAVVDQLELLHDTGPSDTDLISSDPTLTGTVVAPKGSNAGIVVQDGPTVTDREGRFTDALNAANIALDGLAEQAETEHLRDLGQAEADRTTAMAQADSPRILGEVAPQHGCYPKVMCLTSIQPRGGAHLGTWMREGNAAEGYNDWLVGIAPAHVSRATGEAQSNADLATARRQSGADTAVALADADAIYTAAMAAPVTARGTNAAAAGHAFNTALVGKENDLLSEVATANGTHQIAHRASDKLLWVDQATALKTYMIAMAGLEEADDPAPIEAAYEEALADARLADTMRKADADLARDLLPITAGHAFVAGKAD